MRELGKLTQDIKRGLNMKNFKILIVCILVFGLLFSMAACGSKATDAIDEQASADQAAIQAATDQQATVEQEIPTADPAATVDALIASWVDINSPDKFANITKEGDAYQYEDNDAKYPATFADGVLKVKVSDTETADVYIDAKSGHMFSVYEQSPTEFKKK